MTSIALLTIRECHRRPFPFVALLALSGLLLASHAFQAFSFGADDVESANLAISGVFLAGLLHAAFLGTELIRRDLERGTLAVVLTKPVEIGGYLCGRLAGLAAAAALLCLAVALAVAVIFLLPVGPRGAATFGPGLWSGCGRALLPVFVLEAAALAASVFASRFYAPLLLLALFAGGNLAGADGPGLLLPDFAVFGLEAAATPPMGVLMLYTGVQIGVFLLIAYLGLASRNVYSRS